MENDIKEIVINYHINTPCNYDCHFCYAAWGIKKEKEELHHDLSKVKELLGKIYNHFKSDVPKVRLTLAGGEPLLVKNLGEIINHLTFLGFEGSIITNGSLLTKQFIEQHAHHFKVFGVSVDSTDDEILQRIGRHKKGRSLDFQKLIGHLNLLRKLNPKISIKINTVVNKFNFSDQSLKKFLNQVRPNKWKVLRVLPNIKPKSKISDKQWQQFLKNHQKFSDIWTVENNEDMRNSYLMIDPLGRFFDNSKTQGHTYSEPILKVGVKKASSQIEFDLNKFQARYATLASKKNYILYDGDCGFCNRWALFVAKRDADDVFRFAANQSKFTSELLAKNQLDTEHLTNATIVFITVDGSVYTKGRAVQQILSRLSFPCRLLAKLMRWMPTKISDGFYEFVAHNRRRLFKKRTCPVPNQRVRAKFMDDSLLFQQKKNDTPL